MGVHWSGKSKGQKCDEYCGYLECHTVNPSSETMPAVLAYMTVMYGILFFITLHCKIFFYYKNNGKTFHHNSLKFLFVLGRKLSKTSEDMMEKRADWNEGS